MTDIIDTIDQAIGCQECQRPLGSSPSPDFCGEACQEGWHSARAERLEPREYPTHPTHILYGVDRARNRAQIDAGIRAMFEALNQAFLSMNQSLASAGEQLKKFYEHTGANSANVTDPPMLRAIEAKRTRNTGPERPNWRSR